MRPRPPPRAPSAAQAFEAGNYRLAHDLYGAQLARGEDRALALLRLSVCCTALGQVRMARAHALALADLPMPGAVRAQAVRRLHDVGEHEALRRCAASREGGAAAPADELLIGQALSLAGLQDEALDCTRRATAAGLDTVAGHVLHGRVLAFHGRLHEAAEALESALRREPRHAAALWQLAQLRRETPGAGTVDRVRAALQRVRPGGGEEAPLNYALFKLLDDLGDHGPAWQALERGCRARRRELAWNEAAEQSLYEALAASADAGVAPFEGAPVEGPVPIFVIGQPRTGSTLLERFLGRHPQVHAAGELFDASHQLHWLADLPARDVLTPELLARVPRLDLAEFGRRYLAHVAWRAQGRAFIVDKLPRNYLLAGLLARALPRARFLHTRRAAMDTGFSQLKELFAHGYPHSYDQGETARHLLRYQALMARWREVLGERMLEVRYEAMVDDPEGLAARVAAFCGLPALAPGAGVAEAGRPVSTASAVQVREPVNRRGLGRWQPYAGALAPMAEALAAGEP